MLLDEVMFIMPYIGLGLLAGYFSGLLGVGGGWLITPGLHLLGLSIPIAVGCSLSQMIVSSGVSAWKHSRYGHIIYAGAFKLGLPLILGVMAGKSVMAELLVLGLSDTVPRLIFIVVLLLMGSYMLRRSLSKPEQSSDASQQSAQTISWWAAPLVMMIGVLSGLLGMGGGFFMLPLLIYGLGFAPHQAVGTSAMIVLMGSIMGASVYYMQGWIDIVVIAGLCIGAFLGSLLGAQLALKVAGEQLKVLFAILVLVAAVAMLCKQLGYSEVALVILMGSALSLAGLSLMQAFGYYSHKSDELS